jgi:hypothetical protein
MSEGVIAQLEHDCNDIVCIEYEGYDLLLNPEKIKTHQQVVLAAKTYVELFGYSLTALR